MATLFTMALCVFLYAVAGAVALALVFGGNHE